LRVLPQTSVQSFAGVASVAVYAFQPTGGTVVDLGCGPRLDSLIAAQRAGKDVLILGIDFSEAMLDRANLWK